jgi:hypothetical protein
MRPQRRRRSRLCVFELMGKQSRNPESWGDDALRITPIF